MENIRSIEPFAYGYMTSNVEDPGYRIARGMRCKAEFLPLELGEGVFARCAFPLLGVSYHYGSGVEVHPEILEEKIRENPEWKQELEQIRDAMVPLSTEDRIWKAMSQTEQDMTQTQLIMGYGWGGHANPDYGMLLRLGTNGLRSKNAKYRRLHPGKEVFYDGLLLALDALDILARRYRLLALEKLEQAEGAEKARLARIAAAFERVPMEPPRDLFEACQMFWLVFSFDGVDVPGRLDSPGRLDQFLGSYYEEASEEDRRACLDALWKLFHETRTWNLCVGGSDEFGNDMSNRLTYDVLETARRFRFETPNITLRIHTNTPQALWESAAETIASGIGMPALYNDEVVCPALEALGIPASDSHNYCMNGCNQIDIFGKSHMGLEDGDNSLIKCLELVLRNGICSKTGKLLGKQTGDPRTFQSYEDLWKAYCAQVEHVVDVAVVGANRTQQLFAETAPNPYRSNLIQGCMETARDYKAGGPIYGHGQILTEGMADTVDSLASLKRFVFEEKKYTMAQVVDALKRDFEGYEEMYRDFVSCEKFGNDIDWVDEIAGQVQRHYFRYLLTKRTWRGGIYGGGMSTFTRAPSYGAWVSAMPNGRRKDSVLLTDSIGATPGCDKKGPTALLKSVLHYDHSLAKSGFVMQLRFAKQQFQTPQGREAFIHLAKSYFAGGGQQLAVNVLSAEELKEAKKCPERYPDLVVRVGGFSSKFTQLDSGLQDNIIARTEY